MTLNSYVIYDGKCDEAFKFYEKCLGGKIVFKLTNGESPMAKDTPKERLNDILHARFEVNGQVLMGSDAPCGRYAKPDGFSISINVESPEEAERIYTALSENGKVHMPIGETFWARRFAMFNDQFGIPWMINCEKAA